MGNLFLSKVGDGKEFPLPGTKQVVAIVDLQETEQRVAQRGPLDESLRSLFSLPFGARNVREYEYSPMSAIEIFQPAHSGTRWQSTAGWTMVGVSAASLLSAVVSSVVALGYSKSVSDGSSQRDIARINEGIGRADTSAKISYSAAVVGGVLGLVFLLWPDKGVDFHSGDFGEGSGVEMEWRF